MESNIAPLPFAQHGAHQGATPEAVSQPMRVMPHNEQAEQALLGAVLINNEVLDRISELIRPEQFYFPAHGRIYEACLKLRAQLRVADPVTLKQYFEQDGDLSAVGGAGYLAELAGAIVSVPNIKDYAQTLYDLHIRRQLIGLGEEVVNQAFQPDIDLEPAEQIRAAEEKLYTLANEGNFKKDYESFASVIDRALDAAGKALNRDTHLTGVTTGLMDMDRLLGGLQPSDLIILAGRPAMGKTALATNMAFNAAAKYAETQGKEGAVVAFFSLEMSSEQLALRILSDQAEIPSEKIRRGEMKRSDFPRLVEASQVLRTMPMFVDDTAALSVSAMRTRAMRLKRQHNLGMIVVDYLQLMQGSAGSRNENRVQEISEISRGLKMIAKDLDVPVLALSQLSRQVEQREDKRPQLADLRESGSIEQDADVVMFVYRDAYYISKQEPKEGTPEHAEWQAEMDRVHNLADVIVSKQRHGPTGTAKLHFEGAYTRFSNLETRYDLDE